MDMRSTSSDEQELELLFSESRKHPLLSAVQERETDGRKWEAVEKLQQALITDKRSRSFLNTWAQHCTDSPPEIAQFENRDLHFILRRELTGYLTGGAQVSGLEPFITNSGPQQTIKAITPHLQALTMPSSLVVGLAGVIMRKNGRSIACSVADALQEWEQQWPATDQQHGQGLPKARLNEISKLLTQYSHARDVLTMHNLRLVFSIAGKHKGKGVAYLDLIQEGTLGLIRAAEKYEYKKGFRFSTYCYNWITQSVRRYLGDTGGMIRYPTHVQEQVGKLYRERLQGIAQNGAEPSDSTLAKATGISLAKTRNLLQLRSIGASLDSPQFDDDGDTLLDSTAGGPFEATSSEADNDSLQRCLLREMKVLEPAEKEVVIARWGLHQGPPLSRAEIADKLAVSREWVRQLERSALKKLSHSENIIGAFEDYGNASSM
ncbi:MAG: RNA polymerase sigma factor RpoD/SigA [Halioglobus sp.]